MDQREWLETNGLGGFASGTASGIRSRRYHALLLVAQSPPTGRLVLVNGAEVWLESADRRWPLSSQYYQPGVIHPDGHQRIESFTTDPWPTWDFRLDNGCRIRHEVFAPHRRAAVILRWTILQLPDAAEHATLAVRLLMSGRDYHALHRQNSSHRFDGDFRKGCWHWQTYPDLPRVRVRTTTSYDHEPLWYRDFLYQEEQRRGLDCIEDLASPGVFRQALSQFGQVVLVIDSPDVPGTLPDFPGTAGEFADELAAQERARREKLATPLRRAADQYLVHRYTRSDRGQLVNGDQTIVAGYPWFTDWGRDTFIALRGLCLAGDRLEVARDILVGWSRVVSQGMLPNRFPDHGSEPEYNSVDASLWYVIAASEWLRAAAARDELHPGDRREVVRAIEQIVSGYAAGTRFGIRADEDGLLWSGEKGVQLTWMDAKVGEWVVTPRIGKPVEIQALWLNALSIVADPQLRASLDAQILARDLLDRGSESFARRFWNAQGNCLFDVIDVNYERGNSDASFRPNQIFAAGGLPLPLLSHERARLVVDAVEEKLLTPVGLRSLDRGHADYRPHYRGDVLQRDGAYHQGTVWPWLIGPFVEAWLRVRHNSLSARREARQRFVQPLLDHLGCYGLNHVSEVADGEANPDGHHEAGGCPFQAWSLGELIRAELATRQEPTAEFAAGKGDWSCALASVNAG